MTSAKWGRKLKNKNVNKQTDEQVLDCVFHIRWLITNERDRGDVFMC